MKIIARSGVRKYLAELTVEELNYLAGESIGKPFGGYYSNDDYEIKIGTTFNITKAFEQIHRNKQRKGEIITVRKTLEGVINSLDIIDPFIEEPQDKEPEAEASV